MWLVKWLSFVAAGRLLSFTQGSWASLNLLSVSSKGTLSQTFNYRLNWQQSCWTFSYFDCGSMMLSVALTFLMVPPGLNQLCLLFCVTFSLVRCCHSLDMKFLRILERDFLKLQDGGNSRKRRWPLRKLQCLRWRDRSTLTAGAVSRGQNCACWKVGRCQPKELGGKISANQVKHNRDELSATNQVCSTKFKTETTDCGWSLIHKSNPNNTLMTTKLLGLLYCSSVP